MPASKAVQTWEAEGGAPAANAEEDTGTIPDQVQATTESSETGSGPSAGGGETLPT